MNDHSLTPVSAPPHRNALKIAGLYLLIGGLWILFSDELMLALTRDPVLLHRLSIVKGWGFIVTTALLLYWLMRRYSAGLNQSEARYRSLFQNNYSVILLIDPHSGAIVDANPSACAFYGYTHPEITGLKVSDINQLGPEQVFIEMEQARREERRQFFFRHRLANGDIREVEVYSGPIEVQGQQLLYSIVHDITERKRVEADLRENMERLRLALEAAQAGIWEWDLRTNENIWSEELWPLYGLEPHSCQPSYEAWQQTIYPADRARAEQAVQTAAHQETELNAEWRVQRNNGPDHWLMSRGRPLRDSQGQVVRFIGVVIDITERKQLEESLHRSERTLQLFVEYAPADIAMFDRNMVYLAASKRFLADYRLKEQAVVGRSHYDIFPEIPERWKEIHRRCLAGATEMCAEDPFPREDGTLDWVRWEIHPWYEHEGEIGGIILFSEVITERKRAEQEIQTLARFPTENPNPVLRVGLDGRLLYANPASATLLEFWRCLPGELVPPEWQDHIAAAVAQAHLSVNVPCGPQTYAIQIAPFVADGYVNFYGLDITQRQQAEAALRESEARFHGTLDTMQEGVLLIGRDWRYLYINKSAETQGRRPAEELMGRTVMECWPGIEATDFFQLEQKVMQERLPAHVEGPFAFPDGETRWFHWNIQPATDGLLIVTQDITDRKQAEENLRASEAKFRAVFDNAPVGISLLDAERNLLESNDMLAQIVRMAEARLVAGAYRARKYIREDGTEIPVSELASTRAIVERRAIRDVINGIMLEDGETIWTQVSAAPLGLDDPRFVVITQDITARKQAEAGQQRMMVELKRSNADLEQFAYAASHDLQEPLRAVAGMLTLLQQRYGGQLDERAGEFIYHAVEGATRMQTLISDLLLFSRVGTRGKPFQPIASAAALADALANLTVAIRESEAVISYDTLPTVVADRTQLIQLFQNLIGNAIKFRGDRTPEIRINAEQQNGEWLFAVADNGIGLEAENFERIFGVFQRLHTRREYPGTGIGLALCKKIVERHGGRIWVESQPGEGATFYFTLP